MTKTIIGGLMKVKIPCWKCDGAGKIDVKFYIPPAFVLEEGFWGKREEDCKYCKGTGYIIVEAIKED